MSTRIFPILTVQGLVKHFVTRRSMLGMAQTAVKAVDGLSFDVRPGETLALVGESGCGKSTVGRLVLRLIEPTAGEILFEGTPLSELGTRDLRSFRAKAQLIFQDPYSSLNPRLTVGETLAEPLLLHGNLTANDRRARVGELLSLVGLRHEHAQRYPHEFSGGQRQRIAIARALAPEPKLIVCDEPVSALDVSIRSQVLNLLSDLQERLGLSYLFISHDLAVVKHISDRIAVMYLGRIVEMADADQIFGEPRHPYTQALLSAIPVPTAVMRRERLLLPGDPPDPIAPPPGCHLNPRCPFVSDRCQSEPPVLEYDGQHATSCHRWRDIGPPVPPPDDTPRPELERLLKAYEIDRK